MGTDGALVVLAQAHEGLVNELRGGLVFDNLGRHFGQVLDHGHEVRDSGWVVDGHVLGHLTCDGLGLDRSRHVGKLLDESLEMRVEGAPLVGAGGGLGFSERDSLQPESLKPVAREQIKELPRGEVGVALEGELELANGLADELGCFDHCFSLSLSLSKVC